MTKNEHLVPRLIKLRDALNYLSMDINFFDKEVRPFLIEIPVGLHEKAFDRFDLDNWINHYKQNNKCSSITDRFSDNEFAKTLEQICSKKRKISNEENLKTKNKSPYKNISDNLDNSFHQKTSFSSWSQLAIVSPKNISS